ncbi:MAG: hypothetical protein WAK84_07805 [Candidatus Cybelea sp.]
MGAPGVSTMPSSLPVVPTARHVSTTRQLSGHKNLYVTSASPYFFNEYRLPLHNGEEASLTETGVNEPVPIVDDGRDLYVGSFDDGTIFTYPLPLTTSLPPRNAGFAATVSKEPYIAPFSGVHSAQPPSRLAPNGGLPSGLGDPSGLAISGGYLYVAGEGSWGNEVLEYRLPFVSGETPSGSVAGFSVIDFLGIAARNHTLYIASTTAGTVGAYHLPLRKGEAPTYTIPTISQIDGAVGVAVDGDGSHLYVSLLRSYATGDVYEYRLPYRDGETPKTLDVISETGGEPPYGITVSENHLFVGAETLIVSYRLPFTSRTMPEAMVPFPGGDASDVAAGK